MPEEINVSTYLLTIAKGVNINLNSVLHPSVRDKNGKPVKSKIMWKSDNPTILEIDERGNCIARKRGDCHIYISIDNTKVSTPPIAIKVIEIKEIVLSPKKIEIGIGHSKQITAQVTSTEDKRYFDVLLDWIHEDPDPNIVSISPRGYVYGNKKGKTRITAGCNSDNGIWADEWVSVEVVPTNDKGDYGGGFPELKVTGYDIDPHTGKLREGDPSAPALWQNLYDQKHNIWWINLQSKDAFFAHEQKKNGNHILWRMFHAKLLVEMVIQAHMQFEYTMKKEGEEKDTWANHKFAYERKYVERTSAMWEKYLKKYVMEGKID